MMKKKYLKALALLTVFLFLSSSISCATLGPNPDQITTEEDLTSARNQCIAMYTIGGAGLGALAGGLLSGSWKGAGIGAAAGGVAGFAYAWGKCLSLYSKLKSQPVAGYTETAQRTNYTSSQGNIVKIEGFNITPSNVAQGGAVDLNGSYYVMAPEGVKEMKVTETRTVKYFDPQKRQYVDLGSVDQEITAAPGSRKADGKFDIPKDVPDGRFKIAFKVSSGGKEDSLEKEMTVVKGKAFYTPKTIELASLTGAACY
jgi:hypothetical protein